MGIDRPDDADVPSDEPPDRPAHRGPAETRYRQEYDADLRATVEAQERTEPAGRSEPGARPKPGEKAEPAAPSKAREQTENGQQPQAESSWTETAELSRWMWTEYKRRWPREERPAVDRSKDTPGSWHGDGDRILEPADNQRIDAQCDRIADLEREKITPAMRAIESQDSHRHLVGLKDCRKSPDRIKEKVYGTITDYYRSPEQAVSLVPDAIRYTFQYEQVRYTRGVHADIARLQDHGFRLNVLKNYWSDDQYKGVNSQWIEPETGQRFEVQFHTRISFEAKQLTHGAYERLRADQRPDEFEQMVLEAIQNKVTAEVPTPPGAVDIPDYPKRGPYAR